MTHHMAARDERSEEDVVSTIIGALVRLKKVRNDETRAALYDVCFDEAAPFNAEALLKRLVRQRKLTADDVRPHARWLVRNASHRGPLKLGIVLLGACGTEEDVEDLKILAHHEEFALYACWAAANLTDDEAGLLWEIAKDVRDWGRIHVVEHLSQLVEDRPDIQAWLLRFGCQTAFEADYLAYPCATAGHLVEALSADRIDDELLDGACLIISALLGGGPAEIIESYGDGLLAVRHLMRHLETRCDSLERLATVFQLHTWLEWPKPPKLAEYERRRLGDHVKRVRDPGTKWERRLAQGWTPKARSDLDAQCRAVLRQPEWPAKVRQAYSSSDICQQQRAWELSKPVGVDLWDAAYARLQQQPLDYSLYWNLLQTDADDRVNRVVKFAEAHLPLAELASGPADEMAFGPGHEAQTCLMFVVQEMRRDRVFSPALIATALRSPAVQNRNMALAALAKHPPSEWGSQVTAAIRESARDEPDDARRKKLRTLIQKLE
jgi:hypothetical protein